MSRWGRFQTLIRDIFIISGVSEAVLTGDMAGTCESDGGLGAGVFSEGATALQAGCVAQCGGVYFRINRRCSSKTNVFEL